MRPRFAASTRDVVTAAIAEARLRGDRRIGTEHLLLGVLRHSATTAAQALPVELADARAALYALDEEALAALGIHVVPSPRLAAPSNDCAEPCPAPPEPGLFGRNMPSPAQVARLRAALSSGARAVLSQAIDAAPTQALTPERVLAALLDRDPPDPAAAVLHHLGIDRAAARARLAAAEGPARPT